MGYDGQGTIYIPLGEFWAFVAKYAPEAFSDGEMRYGVPRVTKGGGDLEIDYAMSAEGDPSKWAKKPPAVTQWEELP